LGIKVEEDYQVRETTEVYWYKSILPAIENKKQFGVCISFIRRR
jgi:hypothetical protein